MLGSLFVSQPVPSSQVPIPQFVPQQPKIHVTQPVHAMIASQPIPSVFGTSQVPLTQPLQVPLRSQSLAKCIPQTLVGKIVYGMTQHQSNPIYHGTMQIPIGKEYRPYQGIPQVPFQGQQVHGYPRAGQQGLLYFGYYNPPYSCNEVPYYQNPPYLGMKVPISKDIPQYPGHPPPDFNQQFPFVATLKLLDLTRLTNDPITHFPWWPIIPTKFPSDIPKFNGNLRECLSTHVMTYQLWCSSNSINDYSI